MVDRDAARGRRLKSCHDRLVLFRAFGTTAAQEHDHVDRWVLAVTNKNLTILKTHLLAQRLAGRPKKCVITDGDRILGSRNGHMLGDL